ncbi:MAG: exodeoxyribonuclease VII small subunit [Burkholderiaceae bacterium]|nr:exodeoxyribonuclease VII small subunit [Burkholderiaceae bacterium]
MPLPKTADPVSYEAAMEELEQLVGRMESGQWPLDQLQACHQYLQAMQDHIDQNDLPKWVH